MNLVKKLVKNLQFSSSAVSELKKSEAEVINKLLIMQITQVLLNHPSSLCSLNRSCYGEKDIASQSLILRKYKMRNCKIVHTFESSAEFLLCNDKA